jgi:PPOX class probable F420-dependent enzyme
MTKHPERDDPGARLRGLIEDIDFCMLTTVEPDGSLHSRPMSTQAMDEEGCLWFFTSTDSAKAREIRADEHVNLSYARPKEMRYVSVSGTAEVVRDAAKNRELWKPVYKTYFPEGLEDPSLGLLKVHVHEAEFWDDSANRMVKFFKFVKSAATGTPYEADHGKITL